MTLQNNHDIFLVTIPGLESLLRSEAVEKGFKKPTVTKGGVTIKGDWTAVWRANLEIRGASKVLVRLGQFRVTHLAQLDKRARQFPWHEVLLPGVPVRVEAACKGSRIYHEKAATERISKAIHEELGAPISAEAEVCIKARIVDNLCTVSVDTSGDLLHKRGHKEAVNKAPLRETLASLFLRHCGYNGKEPIVDPMCGAGTFVIEAAEIAARLHPGRSRHFAFEHLATFDQSAWQEMRTRTGCIVPPHRFFGFDRDAGAIAMSQANAERAGVGKMTDFGQRPISDLSPPEGTPGLVIVNPPYGGRIGKTKDLFALYQTLGNTIKERFQGWRVGLITNSTSLAKATELPFTTTSTAISHGGINVKVYATAALVR